jgi:hypothetical protein
VAIEEGRRYYSFGLTEPLPRFVDCSFTLVYEPLSGKLHPTLASSRLLLCLGAAPVSVSAVSRLSVMID